MKRITMLAGVLLLSLQLQAQTKFEGVTDYPKFYDISYDTTIQGKLYARTLSNHLVQSTDDGATWDLLYSHPIAIDDLQWLPGNAVLSFSTADGIVIYNPATKAVVKTIAIPQSNVEGATPSYFTGYNIYDAAVTTLVVNTGFGVGIESYGKTFYSSDSGTTWKEIYYTLEHDNVFINDVAIAPNNPQKIFLTRGNGNTDIDGGLFTSTDAGTTFTETLKDVILGPITFKPSDANEILIGTSISFGETPEAVYKSTDNGATWTTLDIEWTDVTLNNVVKIAYNAKNEDQIIILEENEIVTSIDGGATWHNEVYEGSATDYFYGLSASYNPFSEKIVIGTDFFPQYTLDRGKTLTQIKAPFYPTINASVAQTGTGTDLYYGSQYGYLHKDIATGVTKAYDILGPDIFTENYKYAVADPTVAGRVFVIAGGGFIGSNLKVSTDYGATLNQVSSTFSTVIEAVTTVPGNSNIVYVSTRQNDNGVLYKVNLTNPEEITAEEVTLPGETGVVTGVIVTDANTLTIAKLTNFYKTTDGGTTWTEVAVKGLDIDASTDIIWDVAQSPVTPGHWLAATNVGIFKSDDNGINWKASLPGVNVRKVTYSPDNADDAVAAIYTNQYDNASLLATKTNGGNWETIGFDKFNYISTGSVDFTFDDKNVTAYISTVDLGLMSYIIDLTTLGTNNPVASQNAISIYPNPATNLINVASANNSVEIKSTAIYSLTGQKVLESTNRSINISSLSKGIYIVKTQTTAGAVSSQKLVKQ